MNYKADVKDEEGSVELNDRQDGALVDGLDYYLENGLMVFTAHFLRRRGYCCDNGCRHCPYDKTETRLPSSA